MHRVVLPAAAIDLRKFSQTNCLPIFLPVHRPQLIASVQICAAEPEPGVSQYRRRRPLDLQHGVTAHPLGDQIAVANAWNVPNRVISATYAGNPETGK